MKNEQDFRATYYKLSTDTVSLVEGLVGKDHELTLKLRSLRSNLIGAQTPGGPATPLPVNPPA